MNYFENERAFYDAIIKHSPTLKDEIVLKCKYGRREFIIRFDFEFSETLHDALKYLNIAYVNDNAKHIFLTNVPLSVSESELNSLMVDHYPSFNFVYFDHFKSRDGNTCSVKLYVPETDWSSDGGKEFLANFSIREDGSRPFKRLSLKPPYVGNIFVRLWVPDFKPPTSKHVKRNFKTTSNDQKPLHSNLPNKLHDPNPIRDQTKFSVPPAWSTNYCKLLIEQNEKILEHGKKQTEQLENLTHLVTEGITTIHEALRCLNSQVHQVMKRMDQSATNTQILHQLKQKENPNLQHTKSVENQFLTKPIFKTFMKTLHPQKTQSLTKEELETTIIKEKEQPNLQSANPFSQPLTKSVQSKKIQLFETVEAEAAIIKEKVGSQNQTSSRKRDLSNSPLVNLKKQKIVIPTLKETENTPEVPYSVT